ncbi:bifunctional enoyl-CoA hydratase/phosphate acetyltransferase [Pelagibacteraceae bacterium]|nr:bifunctional enoyl-CoA hydratase/phosphate acetyltransferase [Pelagibacteraceae bacterium]
MSVIPEDLKNKALETPNIPAAVVCPNEESVLLAVKEGREMNLIDPILIGNKNLISQSAKDIGLNIEDYNILEADNEEQSALAACQLSNENKTRIIIKGNLHTDILMRSYLKKEFNLLEGKRLSHIWHMTTPQLKKPLFITDGALNVLPRIDIKLQILKNAVHFYNKLAANKPRIAILSGTEDPIDSMPSSIEAKKVMDLSLKEEINAFVHGPLAFDNAVSEEAAKIKKIENEVAGNADILLVPNLETGNSLSKIMVYFMNACAAGIVIGGKVPVVVPSRADSKNSKLASIMAAIVAVKN